MEKSFGFHTSQACLLFFKECQFHAKCYKCFTLCWGAVKYSFMLIPPSPTRESASAGHFQPPNGPFFDIVREEEGGGGSICPLPTGKSASVRTPKPPYSPTSYGEGGSFLDMVRGMVV